MFILCWFLYLYNGIIKSTCILPVIVTVRSKVIISIKIPERDSLSTKVQSLDGNCHLTRFSMGLFSIWNSRLNPHSLQWYTWVPAYKARWELMEKVHERNAHRSPGPKLRLSMLYMSNIWPLVIFFLTSSLLKSLECQSRTEINIILCLYHFCHFET